MSNLASIPADEFKAAFRNHPGGVALITAAGPAGPVALTATSVASLSAEPPILVFSVSTLSSSYPTLTNADNVVVHLLGVEQHHLALLGATSGIDRFADTSLWRRLPSGEPVFNEAHWLRTEVMHRFDIGGAMLIVGRAIESSGGFDSEAGLVYMNRSWHRIGQHTVHDAETARPNATR